MLEQYGFNEYFTKQFVPLTPTAPLSGAVASFTSPENTSTYGYFNPNEVNAAIPDGGLNDSKIYELSVEKLIAGTITSQTIHLDIRDGEGSTFLAAGKQFFGDDTAGFIMGIDDDDDNKVKVEFGDDTDFFSWNADDGLVISGSITANTGYIGGWEITEDTIQSGDVILNSDTEQFLFGDATAPLTGVGIFIGKDDDDYEFRAGDPNGDFIHWDGEDLTITGNLSATTGSIGGWTIGATTLTGGQTVLDSTGVVTVGSGNDIATLTSADATYRLAIGHATLGSAPFRVTKEGALTASGATISGSITAGAGAIGGWVVGADSITDVAGVVGLSSTVTGGDDIRFWAGHATPTSAPFYVTEAGNLVATNATISGSITATTGTIGGFTVGSSTITAGASTDFIGLSTGVDTDDVAFWAGDADPDEAPLTITTAGLLTATNVLISGGTIQSATLSGEIGMSLLNVSAAGWTFSGVFSSTDEDTVEWTSGTFTASNGAIYNIDAGNTGNMTARTFIYLDIGTSTTALQTTTTPSTAVGVGKVLIAVAEDGTGEASFQVFGGNGGGMWVGDQIVANSITAAQIQAGTITADELAATLLYAGTLTIDEDGSIKGGQTGYDTGTGFFLGWDTDTYKFSLGDDGGDKITWDGSSLSISGAFNATSGTIGGWVVDSNSIKDVAGTVGLSSAVTGGDDIRIFAGNATPSSAPFRVTEAGVVTASSGTVGGWTLSANDFTAGSVTISANSQRMLFGSATAPLTGTGVFLGLDGADYEFRAGDPTGDYIHWDGSELSIVGNITATMGTIGGFEIGSEYIRDAGNLFGLSSLDAATSPVVVEDRANGNVTGTGGFQTPVYSRSSENVTIMTLIFTGSVNLDNVQVGDNGDTYWRLHDSSSVTGGIIAVYTTNSSWTGGTNVLITGVSGVTCSYYVVEALGVNTQGLQGENAIVQVGYGYTSTTNTGVSVSLSAFESPDNATVGFIRKEEATAITAGGSFTELFQGTTPRRQSQWANNPQTTVNWTWTSHNNTSRYVAIELRQSTPNIRFWAGSDFSNREVAPLTIDDTGDIKSRDINGNLSSQFGTEGLRKFDTLGRQNLFLTNTSYYDPMEDRVDSGGIINSGDFLQIRVKDTRPNWSAFSNVGLTIGFEGISGNDNYIFMAGEQMYMGTNGANGRTVVYGENIDFYPDTQIFTAKTPFTIGSGVISDTLLYSNSNNETITNTTPRVMISADSNYINITRFQNVPIYLHRTNNGQLGLFYNNGTLVGNINGNTTSGIRLFGAGTTRGLQVSLAGEVSVTNTFSANEAITSGGSIYTGSSDTLTVTNQTQRVVMNSTAAAARLIACRDSDYAAVFGRATAQGNGQIVHFFCFNTSNSTYASRGHVNWNGTTLALTSTSDIRMKKNIVDSRIGLDVLKNIKVRDFNWKGDEKGTKKMQGFIAQELKDVYPCAVSYDEENPKEMWTVANSSLTPLIVKSIQDQSKIIEEQQKRIDTLEARLEKLEKLLK